MKIYIKTAIAETIGKEKFKVFGIDESAWNWKNRAELELTALSKAKVAKLVALLTAYKGVHGVGVVLRDITIWSRAHEDKGSARPRTVEQFSALLKNYVRNVPHRHVYQRKDDNVWLAFYVDEIRYFPEERHHDRYHAAFVVMKLVHEEFGGKKGTSVVFHEADCRGMSVAEAVSRQGYTPEQPELRTRYVDEASRFGVVTKQVGQQYMAVGVGTDDLDGNPESRDSRWYWNSVHTVQLENDGQPTRVVIDVFYEDPKTDREGREADVHTWFWANDSDDDASETEEAPEIEIPVHPLVAVFDTTKHLRLRVHVNYLTEYVYDAALVDRLILPPETKSIVHMLIEHKNARFEDIVKGKAGGAVVLLAGPPGCGKTLTAEVFAESEKRVLYSIQCSQLGTNPDVLENELLKVFARARRWNAVTLLDEADVYVHERGRDLTQNAIVGVFLRVLEYQNSVLFLTTNRPDDVDDAIASRCIARLTYDVPSLSDQAKIWAVLASNAGILISPVVINKIVEANTRLSGRDIKNLLKLATLFMRGGSIAPETIEYVKQFKPTGVAKKEP